MRARRTLKIQNFEFLRSLQKLKILNFTSENTMNVVIASLSFKACRDAARQQSQYFSDQARHQAANPESARRVQDPVTGDWLTAQPVLSAVPKPATVSYPEPLRVSNSMPNTGLMVPPPAQSGAPQNLTLPELRRLPAEDQHRALVAVCAYSGAAKRISESGSKSLRESLDLELARQRRAIRIARAYARESRVVRASKSAAKRDNHKGYRRMKQGGTARMLPKYRAETFYVACVAPLVEGYAYVRRLGRGEKLIITSNSEK